MVRKMLAATCLTMLITGHAVAQTGRISFGPQLLGSGISLDPLPVDPNRCTLEAGPPPRLLCKVTVTATDEARCQVNVEPKAFLIARGNVARENVVIVWALRAEGGGVAAKTLSFDPTAGIDILQGKTRDEFKDLELADDEVGTGPTKFTPPFHFVKVSGKTRSGKFPFAYHYNINILRYSKYLSQWVPCGGIDPLIVNTD